VRRRRLKSTSEVLGAILASFAKVLAANAPTAERIYDRLITVSAGHDQSKCFRMRTFQRFGGRPDVCDRRLLRQGSGFQTQRIGAHCAPNRPKTQSPRPYDRNRYRWPHTYRVPIPFRIPSQLGALLPRSKSALGWTNGQIVAFYRKWPNSLKPDLTINRI
jgi:hypothetical protein